MDGLVLAFIGVMGLALAVAVGFALVRGRALEAIAESLDAGTRPGAGGPGDEQLVDRVARLRRRSDEAEFELERRVRDLAYLADLIGVGIVRLTDELRVEVANTAAHVFLDRAQGSMVGRSAIEAFGNHRIEEIAARAREQGAASDEVALTPGPIQASRSPRNGSEDGAGRTERMLIVRARRSPILGVWVVLHDVAELRRLQRIRTEFIDNLSHELRNPITTIGLLTEGLARDVEGGDLGVSPKMRDRIGKLEVETGNVAQMVSELLDLARIESGGSELYLDEVDLGEVARTAADRLRPFAERQAINLEVQVDPELPSVRGDAVRLGQVFANLIHNAVKFSSRGAAVDIVVAANGSDVTAAVHDTGRGINEADQARIFERFYKADRSRSGGGGTGLGLAISRHVVEGHGGRIGVESREGAGATFTFTIPAAPPPPVHPRRLTTTASDGSVTSSQ